jgi:hypothetical protein
MLALRGILHRIEASTDKNKHADCGRAIFAMLDITPVQESQAWTIQSSTCAMPHQTTVKCDMSAGIARASTAH